MAPSTRTLLQSVLDSRMPKPMRQKMQRPQLQRQALAEVDPLVPKSLISGALQ